MINDFKCWFNELGLNAMARKQLQASEKGRPPKWKNITKNKEIKEKFTEEGKQIKGIFPRSSNDRKAREWLYDLIWSEFDSDKCFTGVKLVMEIELSDMKINGLIYDFNKILQSDADYKIFVFQQKTKDESEELFKMFKLRSDRYLNKSKSSFLLSCWCWETGTFLFKDFKV